MIYLRWVSITVLCAAAIWVGFKIVDNYYGRVIAAEVHKVVRVTEEIVERMQKESAAISTPMHTDKDIPAPPPPLGGGPAPTAVLELPGVKVQLSPDDGWQTVAMLLTTVLGTLLGIRLINRIFEK